MAKAAQVKHLPKAYEMQQGSMGTSNHIDYGAYVSMLIIQRLVDKA